MKLDNLAYSLPVFSLEFSTCNPPYSPPNMPKMPNRSGNLISNPKRSIRE